MTLEQKQKMIKDSENLQRLQSQTQLTGNSFSGTSGFASAATKTNPNQVKDLTETLMAASLSRQGPS
jgi:hypothetical protein